MALSSRKLKRTTTDRSHPSRGNATSLEHRLNPKSTNTLAMAQETAGHIRKSSAGQEAVEAHLAATSIPSAVTANSPKYGPPTRG